MSYRQDPIYRTIQWLRADGHDGDSFTGAFSDAWSRWARVPPHRVEVRIGLINYKPFERARVMADVTMVPGRAGSSPITLNLFLHVFADAQAARREIDAAAAADLLCCYGPPVLHIEARHLVAWTLPNAPNLTELHELLDPERFSSFLAQAPELAAGDAPRRGPTLVRYVPLKRAVLTWASPSGKERYYIKLTNAADAAGVALNLSEISARSEHGEFDFAVPRLVYYSPGLHTLIMTEVPGRPFTSVMSEGGPGPFAAVGRALASLHGIAAVPATIWSSERELADLRRHMNGVRLALPRMASRRDAVMTRLERLPAVPLTSYAPIHGNLFGDQILYDGAASARPVGIVDWDAWCFGDPHFDLGRLIAHLLYLGAVSGLPESAVHACIAALLRAYEDAAGRPVDRKALEWHVAAALLLRAKISSLRKLRPGWPRHFELMIAEAERVLDGARLGPRQGRGRTGARRAAHEGAAA